MSTLFSRRAVLLGAASAGLGSCANEDPHRGFSGLSERVNERVEQALFSPGKLAEAPPHLSPPGAFPIYRISPGIPLAPAGWRLEVSGLVAHRGSFSVEDLRRMPSRTVRVRHHCVEGWTAVAEWTGVPLAELARIVGAGGAADAPCVEFRSFDAGYWSSWDRESALHPQTILAYAMNGAPLGPDHGAPVRVYAAVKLGYKMVKYLTEVRFLPTRTGGYWEDQGYEWYAGV